jgi:ferric-dicitrate binding protein FerR (iron transport regulator)
MAKAPKKPANKQNARAMQRYRISAKRHTQALQELNQKIRNLNGGEPKQPANTRRPITARELDRLINETFLRTLSRFPTGTELAKARVDVGGSTDKIAGVKDLLWALLNTKEFLANH